MSESIVFRGTHIRYYDGRHEEAGAFVRIHMTAEFTGPVMESMGWEDPGDSITEAKLEGELNSTHMILEPGDKQLARHELQLDIKDVTGFKVVAIEKDDVKRRELRFIIRTLEDGAAAKLEQYVRAIGDHQGALKVSYVKQDLLPLEESKQQTLKPTKEKSGCKHCDAGIPTMDNDDATHVNGQDCMVWAPSLIPNKPIDSRAPTAADRKKARMAEEARKQQLREEAGVPVQ